MGLLHVHQGGQELQLPVDFPAGPGGLSILGADFLKNVTLVVDLSG